jgi:FtsZ-binding cell division protein ZapB
MNAEKFATIRSLSTEILELQEEQKRLSSRRSYAYSAWLDARDFMSRAAAYEVYKALTEDKKLVIAAIHQLQAKIDRLKKGMK